MGGALPYIIKKARRHDMQRTTMQQYILLQLSNNHNTIDYFCQPYAVKEKATDY
jgi:hypothetical protein